MPMNHCQIGKFVEAVDHDENHSIMRADVKKKGDSGGPPIHGITMPWLRTLLIYH